MKLLLASASATRSSRAVLLQIPNSGYIYVHIYIYTYICIYILYIYMCVCVCNIYIYMNFIYIYMNFIYYTNIPWISVDNVSLPLYPVLLYPNHVMHSVGWFDRAFFVLSKPPHGWPAKRCFWQPTLAWDPLWPRVLQVRVHSPPVNNATESMGCFGFLVSPCPMNPWLVANLQAQQIWDQHGSHIDLTISLFWGQPSTKRWTKLDHIFPAPPWPPAYSGVELCHSGPLCWWWQLQSIRPQVT